MINHYEIHVTVKNADPQKFIEACKEIGVNPVLLHLQLTGEDKIGDMMTSSRFEGDDAHVMFETIILGNRLSERAFEVVRYKIETWPNHPEAIAGKFRQGQYFECHIPVHCFEKDIPALKDISMNYGAHLSRNAFKVNPDGSQVIMMTLRRDDLSKSFFGITRDVLVYEIQNVNGFTVGKIETEFVLLDSNRAHDNEWLGIK